MIGTKPSSIEEIGDTIETILSDIILENPGQIDPNIKDTLSIVHMPYIVSVSGNEAKCRRINGLEVSLTGGQYLVANTLRLVIPYNYDPKTKIIAARGLYPKQEIKDILRQMDKYEKKYSQIISNDNLNDDQRLKSLEEIHTKYLISVVFPIMQFFKTIYLGSRGYDIILDQKQQLNKASGLYWEPLDRINKSISTLRKLID